jgi:hypothetical protein
VREIGNASTTHPAKFLLIQTPWQNFDFVKCEPQVPA